jgi:serine/threonine-protein kinase
MAHPGPIGSRLDRYQVEALLGAGGFGAVYRARHVHTDALVALKVLKRALGADPGMVERFLREARAAAAVGSDHIVRVLDAGQSTDGTPFLALELLEGVDLKDLAVRDGPLPPMRVVLLCLQVLDGLEAAHKKGIVHRDMKPANAFVVRKVDDRGTDKDFVKLLDFGISKMHGDGAGSGLTMTGVAMGTPSYMAPEQFFDARSVDARADVYSVAVMMYELLSGRLPLDASSYAELIVKVRTESPPHLTQVAPAVPQPLADTVMVGLAKEKEQRWPSAKEFGNALRAAMGLPLPGNTPIPPRATLGAQKVAPAANLDTPSMMMGKTAAPQRATPMPAANPPQPGQQSGPHAAPNLTPQPQAQRQPTPASAQGWVVPTGPQGQAQPVAQHTPTPQPQAPRQPTPASAQGWGQPQPVAQHTPTPQPQTQRPPTPASAQGWEVPPAQVQPPVNPWGRPQQPAQQTPAPNAWAAPQGQMTPTPIAPAPQGPTKSGGAMKWVAIIGGSLIGLCCMCLGVGAMSDEFQKQQTVGKTDPEPTPSDFPAVPAMPELPPLDKVAVPAKKDVKKGPDAPIDRKDLDPDGTELYDSLSLKDKVGDETVDAVLEDIPSSEELADLAAANGVDRNSPKMKKVLAAADRLRQIQRERRGGLTKEQKREVRRLAKDLAKGMGAEGVELPPDEGAAQ